MSKKPEPAVIGAFVVGAAVLVVAAVIAFGKGVFMERSYKYELSFKESIDGLSVGAPVDFMGVRVGSVVDIKLVVDGSRDSALFRPVTIALEASRTSFVGQFDESMGVDEWIETLVERRGLRAQLATQSILTGKLKVNLAFHPGTEGYREDFSRQYPEIPTIPSTQETIKRTVENIPFDAIVSDIRETSKRISELVKSPDTAAVVTNLNAALIRLDAALASADGFFGGAGGLLQDVDAAATNAALLIATLDSKTGPLIDSVTELSAKLNNMMDEQSNIRVATLEAIEELKRSLKSIASLTELLQRHPEALIRGKKEETYHE